MSHRPREETPDAALSDPDKADGTDLTADAPGTEEEEGDDEEAEDEEDGESENGATSPSASVSSDPPSSGEPAPDSSKPASPPSSPKAPSSPSSSKATSSREGPQSGGGPREERKPIELTVYGRTDVGQIREHNEDNFLIADLSAKWRGVAGGNVKTVRIGEGGMLLAVCDGMGGAAAGEVASQLATDIIYERMLDAAGHHDRDQLALDIVEALEEAGARILEESNNNRACRGMGTTATVAALVDDCLLLGQVGDSRAYLLRRQRLVQVTRDQSLVNQLIEAGQLTEEEAENFEHSNIILQALGTADAVQVDLTFAPLRKGDVLMMCSDGLSGMIRDNDLRETLAGVNDPVELCRVLIDDANQAGGHDNITVIVAVFDGAGLVDPEPADVEALKYAKYSLPSWVDERAGETQKASIVDSETYDDTPTIEITGEIEVELTDDWADLLFEEGDREPAEEPTNITNVVIWLAVAVIVFALYYLIAH